MSFYTAIIIITVFALVVLSVMVFENARIPKKTKYKLYGTYGVIAVAALCEWGASMFNGASFEGSLELHTIIKVMDYILSPVAGAFFISQVCNDKRRERVYWGLLGLNALIQIVFLFLPQEARIFIIDPVTNISQHGNCYIIYTIFYCLIMLAALLETALYARRYKNHNIVSLVLIALLIVAGILLQEFGNTSTKEIKTDYICLALASALLFIHYCEFYQLAADEIIVTQKNISVTDSMTGLLNRFAYGEKIVELKNGDYEDFVIYAIDVNGLKKANDSLGHEAGDELIKTVANAIKNSFGKYGDCYRTGGDEFVCITVDKQENPDSACGEFRLILKNFHGVKIQSASASVGYARKSEFPTDSIEQIANRADMRMYVSKRDYHEKNDIKVN